MRLAKFLATAGIASRREAERLVFEGRVGVGGEVVRDPARDVDGASDVRFDGRPVQISSQRKVVYMLNKPLSVVSTASDPQGRDTVVALLGRDERLYPVGRLDIHTTGLILLTNDGDLAHRLTHPSFEVPKTYKVKVAGPPLKKRALESLRTGVDLKDGKTASAKVRRISATELEITIHEGRNRQVRRMLSAIGYRVTALERVSFGPLHLGPLKTGGYRKLNHAEFEQLCRDL